jgi:hypothetical protein
MDDPDWGAVEQSLLPAFAEPSREQVRWAVLSRVPVVALAQPDLGQGRLLVARTDPQRHSVCLAYGNEAAQDGPFVTVTTHVWAQTMATFVAPPTQQALASERDRLFHRAGIDEAEPVGAQTRNRRVPFDDTSLQARVRHEDSLWSAEVWLPIDARPAGARPRDRAFAIIVSRGVPGEAVALRLEDDLEPLWNARDTSDRLRIRRSAGNTGADPLPAATDLKGLEELIDSAVAGRPVGAGPERPLAPRRSRHDLRREWEAALQAQIRYGNQAPAEANRSITMLVSQICELSTSVQWWGDAGPAAIAECIRYTVFDSEVASRPAQLVWRKAVDQRGARAEWLKEWERWHAERAG